MTIEITDRGNMVEVRYVADSGSATAVIVGETVSSIKDRAQDIVDTHNLESKAERTE